MAHTIKALLSHFDAAFRKQEWNVEHEPAPINGAKDSALAKKLLALYSYERLIQLIDAFFASSDPFIVNSGYTFGVFYSSIGKLIAAKPGRKADRLQGLRDFING